MINTPPNPETVKYIKNFLKQSLVKGIIKDVARLAKDDRELARELILTLNETLLPGEGE